MLSTSTCLVGLCRLAAVFTLVYGAGRLVAAQAAGSVNFNVSAGEASITLKQFSEQSGQIVVYLVDVVRGVKTAAVNGRYTPREALDRMVAGTSLNVVQDTSTGALAVRKGTTDPNGSGAAPIKPNSDRPGKNAADDEAVKLSPFVITSDKDVGYLATSTLAGSRLSTPLNDVAAQISVFTEEFMRDMGLTNLEEVYLYSTNVESYLEYTPGGDQGANFGSLFALRNNNRIRGLGSATNLRNFFATGFDIDTYAAERVTIASGPNAILFGLGSPGGITDISLKRAMFRNANSAGVRLDSFGSSRYTLDVNRQILPQKLALRIAGLEGKTRSFREPSKDDNRRLYATMTYQPFANTTLRVYGEWIRRDAARPPMILQRDFVTPWIDVGRPEFNNAGITPITPGATLVSRIPANLTTVYQRANGPLYLYLYGNSPASSSFENWANTTITSGVQSRAPAIADQAFDWSLNRPEVFDPKFNLYGEAIETRHRGHIRNITLEQRLRENLTVEFGYMKEQFRERYGSFVDGGALRIYADPNRYLPDGATPNPNYGKLFSQIGTFGNSPRENREDSRLTLAYEADFTKRSSWLRWGGRHRIAALYEYFNYSTTNQNRRMAMTGKPSFLTPAAQNSMGDTSRLLNTRYYFGSGQNYRTAPFPGGPLDFAEPVQLTGPDGTPVAFNMWHGDGAWGPAQGSKQNVISRVVAGQSYFLNDRLIAFYGWRQDRVRLINALSAASITRKAFPQTNGTMAILGLFPTQDEVVFDPAWQFSDVGQSINWGLVGRPLRWLSLRYSQSENYAVQPNSWFDPYGNPIRGTSGTGRDYGFTISLPDNKLMLRINKFENSQINTRPDNIVSALRTLPINIEQRILDVAPATPKQGVDLLRYAGVLNYQTTNTNDARGYDIELIGNPGANWRTSISIGRQRSVTTVDDTWFRWVEERLPVWRTFGQGWDTETLNAVSTETVHQAYDRWVATQRDPLVATGGKFVDNQRQWRVNGILAYKVTEGRLRGLGLGGGGRWRSAATTGYRLKTLTSGQQVLDLASPFQGPEELAMDGFASYSLRPWTLGSFKPRWKLQINVRNLLDERGYLPTQVRVDGQPKVYTYQSPRQFIVSADAEF